jgi:hypothetical protein
VQDPLCQNRLQDTTVCWLPFAEPEDQVVEVCVRSKNQKNEIAVLQQFQVQNQVFLLHHLDPAELVGRPMRKEVLQEHWLQH